MAKQSTNIVSEKESIVLRSSDHVWGRVTNDPLLYEKNDLGTGGLLLKRTKVENLVNGKLVLISQEEQDEPLLKYNPKRDGDIIRVFFENGVVGTLVKDSATLELVKESEERLVNVTNAMSTITSSKIKALEIEIEELKTENAELKSKLSGCECKAPEAKPEDQSGQADTAE